MLRFLVSALLLETSGGLLLRVPTALVLVTHQCLQSGANPNNTLPRPPITALVRYRETGQAHPFCGGDSVPSLLREGATAESVAVSKPYSSPLGPERVPSLGWSPWPLAALVAILE